MALRVQRLILGICLLGAALATGVIAGLTRETRGRAVVVRIAQPTPVVALPRAVDAASVPTVEEEDSPEASELVERMRRYLPRLADWQADEIRRYHRDFKDRLHSCALSVTAVLDADRESQRRAVVAMRELRRERTEFMRNLIGREVWGRWREVESGRGSDVQAFLNGLRERQEQGETK